MGPPMRHGLSQAGNAGPFVVRSNPIGAVLDAVRGFCFPVQMEEDGNSGFEDIEFGAFSSPGAETGFAYGQAGPPNYYTGPVTDSASCGPGTSWDGTQCVPEGMMMGSSPVPTEDPCGQSHLLRARETLRTAVSACDRAGIAQVLDTARSCRDTSRGKNAAAWVKLVGEAKAELDRARARCKNAASKQTATATAMMQGQVSNEPLPTEMGPTTMTEGNPRMMPSASPMGGMVDPRQVLLKRRGFGVRR